MIRKANKDDIPQIQKMLDDHHRKDAFMRRGHIERCVCGNPEEGRKPLHTYVYDQGGQIIGLMIVSLGHRLNTLFVHPGYRGRGIGTELLNHHRPDIVRVKCNESAGNPEEFYRRNGYHEFGETRKKHIKIYVAEDARQPVFKI